MCAPAYVAIAAPSPPPPAAATAPRFNSSLSGSSGSSFGQRRQRSSSSFFCAWSRRSLARRSCLPVLRTVQFLPLLFLLLLLRQSPSAIDLLRINLASCLRKGQDSILIGVSRCPEEGRSAVVDWAEASKQVLNQSKQESGLAPRRAALDVEKTACRFFFLKSAAHT